MDSMNLFNSPLDQLQSQAIKRKRALLALLLSWFMIMGGLIVSAAILDQRQQAKLGHLKAHSDNLQPRLALAQVKHQATVQYQTSQCLAEKLQALFAKPILGLHLSSVSYSDHWLLEGWTDHPRALDQYKALIQGFFDTSEWIENRQDLKFHFVMRGSVLC